MAKAMNRVLAALFAAVLAMALPVAAFASDSGEVVGGDDSNVPTSVKGATYKVSNAPEGFDHIVISKLDVTDQLIQDYLDSQFTATKYQALCAYEITAYDENDEVMILPETTVITLSLPTAAKYAGYYANWDVEHNREVNTNEHGTTALAKNGNLNISIHGNSGAFIGVTNNKVATGASTAAKSPKTGADYSFAIGSAVVALAVAGGAFALRKRISE